MPHVIYPSPIPPVISGWFPWSRSVMFGSVASEHHRLISHEIIFEVFRHHKWPRYSNHRQTDGCMTCRDNTALCGASCGKKSLPDNNSTSSCLQTVQPFDAHCCHMGTAIQHPVPDRVKPSFVIFDIRALWRSTLSVTVPGCQKLRMTA